MPMWYMPIVRIMTPPPSWPNDLQTRETKANVPAMKPLGSWL
jgi:hypothetical protein